MRKPKLTRMDSGDFLFQDECGRITVFSPEDAERIAREVLSERQDDDIEQTRRKK